MKNDIWGDECEDCVFAEYPDEHSICSKCLTAYGNMGQSLWTPLGVSAIWDECSLTTK